MSLWLGYWEVLAVDPTGKWVCHCSCGTTAVVPSAALESSACGSCGYRPFTTHTQQQRDELRPDEARQLTFDLGGWKS
jgi:hypothetical protein